MAKKIGNSTPRLALAFSPLWRGLARYLTAKCEKCGQERLLSVFDFYSGDHRLACGNCLLASAALKPMIHFLFSHLGIGDLATRRITGDPMIRRCMLSVVKGIAIFGLMSPQPCGPPITIVWNFTNRCNLNCLHCHQDPSPTSSGPQLSTSQALSC
jgi:hypothetical protein